MYRCIQLAKNGLGTTYPNPLVGSVIVSNEKIIGEGWHYKAGSPHAEVNAIGSVRDKSILSKATIFVSLEPCSHYGKTPPCADLIVESGIKNVVIGSLDPNPQVAGRGVKKLIDAGCHVEVGILEKECLELNKRFFTFHQQKRPYIILKWAETLDRFISPKANTRTETKPVWITNPYSRQIAHKMRGIEMAIMVGTNTVLQDNPSLTTRHWSGNNPIRVVLDRSLKIPSSSTILDRKVKTYIFTETKEAHKNLSINESSKNNIYIEIDFNKSIAEQINNVLYEQAIQSVIIEGGSKTLQTFIDNNLWDEAHVFTGATTFGQGVPAPAIKGSLVSVDRLKGDSLKIFKNLNVSP